MIYTTMNWSFGKYWLNELCRSSMLTCFIIQLKKKKSHLLILPLVSLEQSFKYREAIKCLVADIHFPKFRFAPKSLNFIFGTNIISCFFLK